MSITFTCSSFESYRETNMFKFLNSYITDTLSYHELGMGNNLKSKRLRRRNGVGNKGTKTHGTSILRNLDNLHQLVT